MMLKLRRVRTLSDVFGVPVPFRHLVCIGPMQNRTREGLVGTRTRFQDLDSKQGVLVQRFRIGRQRVRCGLAVSLLLAVARPSRD